MSTVKRIAKNTLVLTVADVFSKVLSLILIAYLARFLGDVGFGKYSFAFSFTALFMVLTDLGLSTLTVREVARDKSRAAEYLGNIGFIKILLSLLTFALIFIAINFMQYPPDTRIAVYILGVYWILTSFVQFFRSIFRAFEQMEYEALTTIIERIIAVSLGLLVLFSGYGLIEFVLVLLFAGVVNAIISFFIVVRNFTKPKFEIDLEFWKHLIKEGLPFGVVFIFITLYFKIDITMLSLMKGDAAVGWYYASVAMIEALTFIPAIFMISLFPVISRFFVSSKESLVLAYEKSFKYLFILGLPIAVGTTLLADRFVLFIYGGDFVNSIISLKILSWALLFIFLNYLLGAVLRSIDRQTLNAYISGIAVFLNISLNLFLIPKFSYIGAAVSTALTEGFVLFLYFYYISKFVCRLSLHKIIIKPLIASLTMGFFVYSLGEINLILLVPIATAFYFGSLYIIKGFHKDDIELFRQILA
jgi:O-antigen/teichoic acid export membrane protein